MVDSIFLCQRSLTAIPFQIPIDHLHLKLKRILSHNKTDLLKLDSWSNFGGSVHNMPDFEYTEIDNERLYAVISRKMSGINSNIMQVSDLGKFPLLTGEKDSHFYVEMEKLYRENGIPFNVSFMNTSETSLMQDMVRDGVGIILATESTAMSLEDAEIAALPIEPKQDLVTLILYPEKRKLRGAYLAFRNYISDAYKRTPGLDSALD